MADRSVRAAAAMAVSIAMAYPLANAAELDFGNVRGEVVNYETPLIRPLIVTADESHVVALDEPDHRVVVRDRDTLELVAEVAAGQGLCALAERPGGAEIWAVAMHQSSVFVIDTSSWRVTHVLAPPMALEGGLGDAAAPGGIAFSEDGSKAWVVGTATDVLNVYDAELKRHLKTVPLAVEHYGRSTRLEEPRAIVRRGDTLYVLVYKSGNQTAAGPFELFGSHPEIQNLERIGGRALPDADVLALSAIDESVLFHQRAVGTLNFGLAVHPDTGQLIVSHMDARNAEFVGERSFPKGRVYLNGLSFLTPSRSPASYHRVALEDLPVGDDLAHVAMPTDVAVDARGRVYVAGYASANVAVLDSAGALLGLVETGRGPRGLAVARQSERLFVLHRIDGTISAYDISGELPGQPALATTPIGRHDPTYDDVHEGRAIFNRASQSGGGSTGCFSCHIDLQQDGLAWELSAYHDIGDGFTPDAPPQFWLDRKFSMMTQDMRSREDTAPYHWRGEQQDLEDFNAAFENLLKGPRLDADEFALMKAFVFSAVFPPNPHQPLDRGLSSDAEAGLTFFREGTQEPNPRSCERCHALPLGMRGGIESEFRLFHEKPPGLNAVTAQPLRGLWTKASDLANVNATGPPLLVPVTGFGFDRTGSHRDLTDFVSSFQLEPELLADVVAFLDEFDSGLAPATARAEKLDVATVATFDGDGLVQQARQGHCDLVARGRLDLGDGWIELGLYYDRQQDAFIAGTSQLGTFSARDLIQLAEQGRADLVFIGVPLWSGERIGIDRDRDGVYDGDELVLGTDPNHPDSDGDGYWDSYDDEPLVPGSELGDRPAPQVSGVVVDYVTSNAARVFYQTDTFSPTHVVYGETEAFGQTVGDPLVLPAGSNRWKRRHSVVLRGLRDGAPFHFKVLTRGQNGLGGEGPGHSGETLADASPTSIHVAAIELEALPEVSGATVEANVSVQTNAAAPAERVEVHGVWTLFQDGLPVRQEDGDATALTDDEGRATLRVTFAEAGPGDRVHLAIPMWRGEVTEALPGLVDRQSPRRPFSWPDSAVTGVEVSVP